MLHTGPFGRVAVLAEFKFRFHPLDLQLYANYRAPLNWKLANDTYGENYNFENLNATTINKIFIGNVSTFDQYGQNHRLTVPNGYLDKLRNRPQALWNASDAAAVAYFVFPNAYFVLFNRVVSLFTIYPVPGGPGA